MPSLRAAAVSTALGVILFLKKGDTKIQVGAEVLRIHLKRFPIKLFAFGELILPDIKCPEPVQRRDGFRDQSRGSPVGFGRIVPSSLSLQLLGPGANILNGFAVPAAGERTAAGAGSSGCKSMASAFNAITTVTLLW